jgi:hypothetical protein
MLQRCRKNDNHNSSRYYSEKDIKVCERWGTYELFAEDMRDTFADGLSLDRVDNSSGYYKENCRWVEPCRQARNRSKTSANKSGVTGVSKYVSGWRVDWRNLDGTKGHRYFSTKRFSGTAFEAACAVRQKVIDELNQQGAGYSELHGI